MIKGKLYVVKEHGKIKDFGCFNYYKEAYIISDCVWYWTAFFLSRGDLCITRNSIDNYYKYELASIEDMKEIKSILEKDGKYTLDNDNMLVLLPAEKRSKKSIKLDIQHSDLSSDLKNYIINNLNL